MAGLIATIPKYQFSGPLGLPLASGTLETYVAGSMTPATTWQDEALTIANTNPIILDSRGECVLWLDPTKKYKFILKNFLGAIQWTQDNITGAGASALSGIADLQTTLAASGGSALLGFIQAGAGAVARTAQDKMRDVVSVKDFGAKGDGVTDDTLAFKAAISFLSASQSLRGGTLWIPPGRYKLTDTLTLTSYATDNAINIRIEGAGWLSTQLDFSTMTGAKNCILVANDQQLDISGFFLLGGAGTLDGIHLGTTVANGVSVFRLHDIRVQGVGRHGFYHYNSYMGQMTLCYALACGQDGFHFAGFHTSIYGENCYARGNTGAGLRINGMVYSAFTGCGFDANAIGVVGQNMRSVTFTGVGAEGNQQDGFWFNADNAGATAGSPQLTNPLFVQECYDVSGVLLQGCSGYGNNSGNAGYSGLVRCTATGVHTGAGTYNDNSAHRVRITVRDGDVSAAAPYNIGIVTAQSGGGQVTVVEDGNNRFLGGRTVGASTRLRNVSMRGLRCIMTLATDVSIPNALETVITWSAALDELGAWSAGAPTLVKVPDGVSRIRIGYQTGWGGSATGARRSFVSPGGAAAVTPLYPNDDRTSAGAGSRNFGSSWSPILAVTPGQTFQLNVEQSSGGALLMRGDSYFAMEVIE